MTAIAALAVTGCAATMNVSSHVERNQGFTRLTIRGRSHTLPRHVASEAEHERVQAPCSRDFQLLAAKQV